MAIKIDDYFKAQVNTKKYGWVIARPLSGPFIDRIKDAILVLFGKADAVTFYED